MSNPLWVLLGAVVGAAATLLSVAIKHFADMRVERAKHILELQKVRLQQEGARLDALWDRRIRALAEYLDGTQQLYRHISQTRSALTAGQISDDEYTQRLRAAPAVDCQVMLEVLHLLVDGPTVTSASALWDHLRGEDFPRGRERSGRAWKEWKDTYWQLRNQLTQKARGELGIDEPPRPNSAFSADPYRNAVSNAGATEGT